MAGEQQPGRHGGGVVDRGHVERPGGFALEDQLVRQHSLGDDGDVDLVVVERTGEHAGEICEVGAVGVDRLDRQPLRSESLHREVAAGARAADQDCTVDLTDRQPGHDRRPDVG
ncbi:MAG TPA: hypothetical protein VFX33_05585 [Actinomycetales bacterium]|nr:hypothetical protein [Actinomycetales bacterium]